MYYMAYINVPSPYVNGNYVEQIFNYLRVFYPFINDLDIEMQATYKPVIILMRTFLSEVSDIPSLKRKTVHHNQLKSIT